MVPKITHILVTTDGSELSNRALTYALAIARPAGARITVLTVSPPQNTTLREEGFSVAGIPEVTKRLEAEGRVRTDEILRAAKAVLAQEGATCDTLAVLGDRPYEVIIEQAGKLNCDLIVMTSRGHGGFKAAVLGSETSRVLSNSTIPVLVCR